MVVFLIGQGAGVKKVSAEEMAPVKKLPSGSITIDGSPHDWDSAGIGPLAELEWLTSFSKPAFKERMRIRSVSVAYDENNLFLLFNINPGIREDFETTGRTGSLAYIYLDSDGSDSSGWRRNADDTYAGWDYRIYIPTGFGGGTTIGPVTPLVEYKLERIKETVIEKVKYGYKYNSEYEDVPNGAKSSLTHKDCIAFHGDYLEICIPLVFLSIKTPTPMKIVIQDLSAFPQAETRESLLLQ